MATRPGSADQVRTSHIGQWRVPYAITGMPVIARAIAKRLAPTVKMPGVFFACINLKRLTPSVDIGVFSLNLAGRSSNFCSPSLKSLGRLLTR